jgi:hypothetical protein
MRIVLLSTNMRFLCLHGRGTSADIFESQLGNPKFLDDVYCNIVLTISLQGPSNHVWHLPGPVTSILSMLNSRIDRHLTLQISFHHLTLSGTKIVRHLGYRTFTSMSGV